MRWNDAQGRTSDDDVLVTSTGPSSGSYRSWRHCPRRASRSVRSRESFSPLHRGSRRPATNGWGTAHVRYGFGSLAQVRGDNARALSHFSRRGEAVYRAGARTEIARCLAGIGLGALAEQDLPKVAARLAESLELSIATGQSLGVVRGIEALAAPAVFRGDDDTAARLGAAAAATRQEMDTARPVAAQARLNDLLAAMHRRIGPTHTAELVAEGRPRRSTWRCSSAGFNILIYRDALSGGPQRGLARRGQDYSRTAARRRAPAPSVTVSGLVSSGQRREPS